MPINNAIFTKPENTYLFLDSHESLASTQKLILDNTLPVWAHVITQKADGAFLIISNSELQNAITEFGNLIWNQSLITLPLNWYLLDTLEQNSIGTGQAQSIASSSYAKIIGVTNSGKLVGIINKTVYRDAIKTTIADTVSEFYKLDESGDSAVQFSVFVKDNAIVESTFPLYAYVHFADMLSEVTDDLMDFAENFDGEIPSPQTARQTSTLALATLVTAEVICDGLEILPAKQTKRWLGFFTRYSFQLSASKDVLGEPVLVHVRFLVNEIEIARTRVVVRIKDSDSPESVLVGVQEIENDTISTTGSALFRTSGDIRTESYGLASPRVLM